MVANRWRWWTFGLVVAGLLVAGCPQKTWTEPPHDDDDDTTGGDDDDTTWGDDDDTVHEDFVDLRVGGGADPAWEALFTGNSAIVGEGPAPAVIYPQHRTHWPFNWPAVEFSWFASADGSNVCNLYYLVIDVPEQAYPLRLLTTELAWIPEWATWYALKQGAPLQPLELRIYGASVDLDTGTLLEGPFVAPDATVVTALDFNAPGRIIFWATSDEALHRIELGDTTDHYFYGPNNNPTGMCEGCHAGTPDGKYIASSTSSEDCVGCSFYVSLIRAQDLSPLPGLHPSAASSLQGQDSTLPSFSEAFWTQYDQRMILVRDGRLFSLDLLTGQYGEMAVAGDPDYQALPDWSPDGQTVVYVSSPYVVNGRTATDPCDLYTVEYNQGSGGTAQPVPGAAEPGIQEYYPDISPDGHWIAFNRSSLETYNAEDAEVFLIPLQGGMPERIAGNDPPPILGETSPGLTNSWPKWAPDYHVSGADTWFFLAFSSARHHGLAQIWISPLKVNGGAVTSYPALHLPGQNVGTHNHTPVWFLDKID